MRIEFGPGYRIYYTRRGLVVYLLLLGGDKGTQRQDIAKAKMLVQNLPQD
jgi:putative addiction module killer protein